jgi:hypothetical protein
MGRFLFALAISAIVTQTAHAQQKTPLTLEGYLADGYAMMRDFGRCSALQDHLAKFLEANGKPANAEQMRDFARGALVAANTGAWVDEAQLGDLTPDQQRQSDARIIANTKTLESIMALETNRQAAFAERGEMDVEQMQFCAQLSKVTTQIVESLRKSGALNDN